MPSLTRLIGLSVLILFLFLAAAVGAQAWLRQQGSRLRGEAIDAKRAQFAAIVTALAPTVTRWSDVDLDQLGAMCGARVSLHDSDHPAPPASASLLYFDHPLPDPVGRQVTARVAFAPSPLMRLLVLHQWVTVGLLFLGFVLLATGVAAGLLFGRAKGPSPELVAEARKELHSLAQLAATSTAQHEALSRERDERRLAEEDAVLKQTLLNQAIEGRVRLGHDLHDSLIQSLYAAGLTIESARTLVATDPAEADRRLAQCVAHLNSTIRDVRAFITGLAPAEVRRAEFGQAIEAAFAELRGDRPAQLDLRIDAEAAGALNPDQSGEALQVVREAVSNALRHGGASLVTVRLHRVDREVCVLVQDNGAGFDPGRARADGLGLRNLQARAARLGGTARVESSPGTGTRVILTFGQVA
ncbi:MAG TPA: sensor histidine kinase [Opitutaceae bacterium]|nr:sensor histidine kinase [Opitutaceae bacterium]